MNPLFIVAAPPPDGPSTLLSLAPMFFIFIVFYFIWFMPLRKKQKALDALREGLKKGDRVITTGGFFGEVVKVDGRIVVLKLSDNVKVRIALDAIGGLEATQDREGNRS